MQSDELTTVGPIDAATIRPARTLVAAKVASAALVAILAVVGGFLLAPRVLAGVGLVQPVSASMTAISPTPNPSAAGSSTSPGGDGCVASTVTLKWGDAHTGTARWCTGVNSSAPKAGDTVRIWTLAGFDPVPASAAAPWLAFDVILLILLAGGATGIAYYGRELAALGRLRAAPIKSQALLGQVDRITIGRAVFGKEGRAAIGVILADEGFRPLNLTLPGPVDRTLLGASITLHALRTGHRGKPAGPYVLVRGQSGNPVTVQGGKAAAAPGRRIALGRAIQPFSR